jgi:hypothetical protein
MTKVDASLKLSRALTEEDLKNISRVHSVYGMFIVRASPSGDDLFVEYDASRLSPTDVQGILTAHGIPLR